MNHLTLHRAVNRFGLMALIFILLAAFFVQLNFHELPCPLCLLQRVCYIALGLAVSMNLLHGPKPGHYGLMILAALAGIICAGRQVLLHIAPGTGTYGRSIFSLHLYSWSVVFFSLAVLVSAVMLLAERGFLSTVEKPPLFCRGLVGLFVCLIALNALSAFLECGLMTCPDNPQFYRMLN